MIANYGYEDGTGFYYLAIDTDKCADCDLKQCVSACNKGLLVAQEDDWGDEVIVVSEDKVHSLKACCDACRQSELNSKSLPCLEVCSCDAIQFTW